MVLGAVLPRRGRLVVRADRAARVARGDQDFVESPSFGRQAPPYSPKVAVGDLNCSAGGGCSSGTVTSKGKLMPATLPPRIGIIGGSGLDEGLLGSGGAEPVSVHTPFGPPAAAPVLAQWRGIPLAILARHGRGHIYPPGAVPYRANIFALKALGCRWILATGAVGSLRPGIAPRELVLVDQAIDRTLQRPRSFFDAAAVHVAFAEPVCETLRRRIYASRGALGPAVKVHPRGTYLCMEGPSFSTRAESRLYRSWGADVIGMTLLPEARLAREAQISYACIALVTDYDCWKVQRAGRGDDAGALLQEIRGNLRYGAENAVALIRAALPRIWAAREETLPAHRALELAIWSDQKEISAAAKRKLGPLWPG